MSSKTRLLIGPDRLTDLSTAYGALVSAKGLTLSGSDTNNPARPDPTR
jgi:hypothetical protein